MVYYYTLFAFFAIVCYLIVTDKNVGDYIVLQCMNAVVQVKRIIWMIRFHPGNPIAKWMWERRVNKMVREFEKEYLNDELRQSD